MLCVSERKVDRIKKKFVLEGLELTLNRQPSRCEYDLKIDGRLEAQLLALSCSAPPEGQARWSLRLLADRLVGWSSSNWWTACLMRQCAGR